VELMGFMGPALIAVYAITAGSAAIAGEEDRGGLEVTLSAPVSRAQLFGQRLAALAAGIATLMIATGAALWVFSALLDMGLGLGAIASAATALGLFGLFAGAVAIAVGAATGRPALARGVAALAVVASYLINALAQVTSALRPARPLSPYYLVFGNEPLTHGLRLAGAVSVLAAVAVLAAAGGILFARRDLN
jgi:ABC-2 type transport system permease protein